MASGGKTKQRRKRPGKRRRERQRTLRQARKELEIKQAAFDRDCADIDKIRADAERRADCRELLAEADAKLSRKAAKLAEIRRQLSVLEVR